MDGEAGDKGGGGIKTLVGIALLVVGNILAVKFFPGAPEMVMDAKGGSYHMQVDESLPMKFKMLMMALLLLNVGALALYLGKDSKAESN